MFNLRVRSAIRGTPRLPDPRLPAAVRPTRDPVDLGQPQQYPLDGGGGDVLTVISENRSTSD
ncbi:MAG: hypothetical protein JWR32_5130 [Mycobacterium sp.]|jgi:hypothetical protein|nr:hypothetical protein [Mycobacterium sp.]